MLQVDEELAQMVTRVRKSLVGISNGRQGHGAGTIWHSDGLIITNAHVVQKRSPTVLLPNELGTLNQTRKLPARVLAHEPALDIAVLVVEASGLPSIELGESTGLRPGHWVMALGHPWGVQGAVTAGVVIGVGDDWHELPRLAPRSGAAPVRSRMSRRAARDPRNEALWDGGAPVPGQWIVASLKVRPGHSGGPLVDVRGRLVGINTMMAGPGVGVAVPVHVVKAYLKEMLGRRPGDTARR
jgi:serine protease Do